MAHGAVPLGIGIGWRPEIAGTIEALPGIDWVEVVAENICPGHLPDSLFRLRARGTKVIPHGVSLGIGGADRPDAGRLADLAARAEALGAPLVTEHVAFVRAGGHRTASPVLEAGHLLPVPRTWDALRVLCENVRIAQDQLPVPLALENIAALISWPGEQLTEGQFLAELVDRTGVGLLVDVANLHTNHVNRGEDPAKALDELPVEAIAYVHVAGGVERDGVWHDTHAHPVTRPVLDVLAELRSRVAPPGVLLERDEDFPAPAALAAELDLIRDTVRLAPAAPGLATVGTGPVRPLPRTPAPTDSLARAANPEAPTPVGHRAPLLDPGTSTPADRSVPFASPGVPVPAGRPLPVPNPGAPVAAAAPDPARQRVALAQAALLSALLTGAPVPEGFDGPRLRVQSRALTAKRADIVAKVAPELPEILGSRPGSGFRPAFSAYARTRPMSAGYRRDALDFAEHTLVHGTLDPAARRALTHWWQDRVAARPPSRVTRFLRSASARVRPLPGGAGTTGRAVPPQTATRA
ncbi:multinuclear nonheme iron-dependent oxidase [Streptomyces candidus]|uniref:SCO6045-like C-terminal domain-containing protein n=1 Tax=Streptomyces candidus TaxID=67283 RepID=A0A7X0HB75_9ACTN|nr:DUF692 family multinuclear iron-containing protein [Streptomyces candidus]MBB6434394.1 hypothetical protein [Streptomyces candidus]GHH36855.1 UPF0276 protein [Streptomyces candidus]